jgi:hypothetical protein
MLVMHFSTIFLSSRLFKPLLFDAIDPSWFKKSPPLEEETACNSFGDKIFIEEKFLFQTFKLNALGVLQVSYSTWIIFIPTT